MSDRNIPDDERFTLYTERRPEKAGPYLWRLKSTRVSGLVVEFVAHMRMRGAGHREVLSPTFDHWNGYEVFVPPSASWAATDITCEWFKDVAIRPLVDALVPCPFCQKVPTWTGCDRDSYGGVSVTASPERYNEWRIECCSWISAPRMKDPRELVEIWNKKIRGCSHVH